MPFQPDHNHPYNEGLQIPSVLSALKTLLYLLPFCLGFLFFDRIIVGDYLVASLAALTILLTLFLRKELLQNKTKWVPFFLSVTYTITLTFVCTLGNGVHDIMIIAFPLILGFSGIVLNFREIIFTSLLTFIAIYWLVFNEQSDIIVVEGGESGPLADFLVTSLLIVMGTILSYTITNNIKNSLDRANEESSLTKQASLKLGSEVKEKEKLISEIHRTVFKSLSYIELLAEDDAQSEDEFNDLNRKIAAIGTAHELLHESSKTELVDLKRYLSILTSKYESMYEPGWEISHDIRCRKLPLDETVYFGFTFIEMLHLIKDPQGSNPKIVLRSNGKAFDLSMKSNQIHDQSARESSFVLIEMMAQQLDGNFEIEEDGTGKSAKFSFELKEERNG